VEIQNVITAKKIKYVTGTSSTSGNYNLNDDIADKIWLFSEREMYGTGQYTGGTTEGLGTNGAAYSKFTNTESKYYIQSGQRNSATDYRKAYGDTGYSRLWWLRSCYLDFSDAPYNVANIGALQLRLFVY